MKNRTIISIVCIVLAVATMFGIAPFVTKLTDGKTSIVRITQDIPQGTAITEDMVTTVEIGKTGLQENAVTDTKAVVGKYATCDIKSGTNILASYLTDSADNADAVFRTLNGTKQAVSITIDSFAGGVSGKLKNGDIVSIIVTREKQTSVPAELTYVRVITTTTATGIDKDELKPDETDVIAGLIQKCVDENASDTLDQAEFTERYNGYVEKFESLNEHKEALKNQRNDRMAKNTLISEFMFEISEMATLPIQFDERLWSAVVDQVTVYEDERLVFTFKNGAEITEQM